MNTSADFENVSRALGEADPALLPLMERLHRCLLSEAPDLRATKDALVAVLTFLASPQGRTEANCNGVNWFLAANNLWGDNFPEAFSVVIFDMAGQLHDTFSAPHIAANFESTPEQLLARAHQLKI